MKHTISHYFIILLKVFYITKFYATLLAYARILCYLLVLHYCLRYLKRQTIAVFIDYAVAIINDNAVASLLFSLVFNDLGPSITSESTKPSPDLYFYCNFGKFVTKTTARSKSAL